MYDHIARNDNPTIESDLPVQLSAEEKKALRQERDNPFSEKGMRIVIATVSLAALLQGELCFLWVCFTSSAVFRAIYSLLSSHTKRRIGFVQSSFNGASLMSAEWGLPDSNRTELGLHSSVTKFDWQLGAANGSPWFFAAFVGCPLALPINYWFGRRGGIAAAAFLIMASSVGAIFVQNWRQMFGVRVINGIGLFPAIPASWLKLIFCKEWVSKPLAPLFWPVRLPSDSGVALQS